MKLFKSKDEKYLDGLNRIKEYSNNVKNAYPQTKVCEMVNEFMDGVSAKKRKCLIIGFDGARADSLSNIFDSVSIESGLRELLFLGGKLALSYAGGDEVKQDTSTMQGWASILTGVWASQNGVFGEDVLNTQTPTCLRTQALKGKKTLFMDSWEPHFSITYSGEIKSAAAENIPQSYVLVKDDEELVEKIYAAVNDDTDLIMAIFQAPDAAGHSKKFGNKSKSYCEGVIKVDRLAYDIITEVRNRETKCDEEWLFILTSDHGGHNFGHGTQSLSDRMTFICSNKQF